MSLEHDSDGPSAGWDGQVPTALDGRLVAFVVVAAALAASVNLSYGGPIAAGASFSLLAAGGVAGHVVGERRLRHTAEGLATRWREAGGRVDEVARSADANGTQWTLHTSEGPVVVGGLALAPISRVSVTWNGIDDEVPATTAQERLDAIADEWYAEIFE